MNILFLSIVNLDDIEEKGIYSDLMREFRDMGHNVYIVCSRERRLRLPTEYVNSAGISILGVKTGNLTKTNIVEKGISTIMIEKLFIKALKRYMSTVRFDLVLYSTPPITFEKVVRFIKNRDKARTYLLLKDIFPQNAVDLEMFTKNSIVYRYFRKKEKRLYAISDYIGCMSQANVDYVLKNNPEIPRERVEICPNSLSVRPAPPTNEEDILRIRNKFKIPADKVVFVYGGNLGKPQGIDFLIECLKSNESNHSVYFVIAGSGTEFGKIRHYVVMSNPANVLLLERMSKQDYEELLSACDVGLILLDKRFTIPNFPSRLLSYMEASKPVLAATDVNTDVGKIVQDGGFGYWCESSQVSEFNHLLRKFSDEKQRKEMGQNARRYLENHFTVKHSYSIIMNHFQ